MQIPEVGRAEERAFDDGRVFGLDREASEQAGGRAVEDDRARRTNLGQHGQTQRQYRGAGGEEVVEDGRLPSAAAEQRQPQDIGGSRKQGRRRSRAQHPPAACHQPRRGGGEQRRDQLVGEDAIAGQQPDRGEDQEQADGLAVPQIDIGHGAVQHPVADEQIILLVDMDDRVAEIMRTQGDCPEQQQRERHPSGRRQPCVRGGRCAVGHGARS